MHRSLRVMALTPVLFAAACTGTASFQIGGQSVEEAALELINGDLAQVVGLGPLMTTCDEVVDPEVGTEFTCESVTGDNEVILWAGVVDREDHIDVESQNVILGDVIPNIEESAVTALYGDNPLEVVIDCGESARILDNNEIVCDAAAASDPATIHDATITFTDLETGDFNVVVSDEPRE